MKQSFLSILLMLLPMLASADAVEIDGIWYNFIPNGDVIEVTRNPSGFYSGSIAIPKEVTYEGSEYCVPIIGEAAFHAHDSSLLVRFFECNVARTLCNPFVIAKLTCFI